MVAVTVESPALWNWVAIGTILLAIATFTLALYNRKTLLLSQDEMSVARSGLEAARRQNEVSTKTLDSQTAPILANVPWGVGREVVWYEAATGEPANFRDAASVAVSAGTAANQPWVTISVPFRNVGNGVALITSVHLMIGGSIFDGTPKSPVVPPGESSRAGFEVGRSHPGFDHGVSLAVEGIDFAMVVGYADAGGAQRGAISLDVHRENPQADRWRVRQLHIGPNPDDALSRPTFSSLPL
jgi:hypothetical protein